MKLILYSKPDCCLCQGLQKKLTQISSLNFDLEVRDITANPEWLAQYKYEIPVLCWLNDRLSPAQEHALPRLSPRSPLSQLEALLQKTLLLCEN